MLEHRRANRGRGAAGQVSESWGYRYSSIDSDPVTFILGVRTERMCAESLANIPRHDQEIVDLRDQGQHEEEQAQRKERDVTTGVIAETCTSPAMSKSGDLRKLLP